MAWSREKNQKRDMSLLNEDGNPAYSARRTKGTEWAEAHVERHGRGQIDPRTGERRMLVPPTPERLLQEKTELLIADLDALEMVEATERKAS